MQREGLFWFPLTQLQFPALWQFQSLHDSLPNGLDHLAELEAITNQLISAAEVNKQILTSVPHDLIE
jgi:ubiquitin-like 1-activating enzyme E1 A